MLAFQHRILSHCRQCGPHNPKHAFSEGAGHADTLGVHRDRLRRLGCPSTYALYLDAARYPAHQQLYRRHVSPDICIKPYTSLQVWQ